MNFFQQKRHVFAFLTPALSVLLVLLLVPIVYSLWVSLKQASGMDFFQGNAPFVGLENYSKLVQDPEFLNSLWLLLVFIALSTSIELLLATSLAIYMDQCIKPFRWLQTMMVLPMFVIPVVSGLGFRYMFDPEVGAVASVFYKLDLLPPDFFGDPFWAMGLVILQDVWRMWPFLFLIVLAGLKAMPREPVEAMKIDGATFLQIVRFLIFPALKHTLLIAVILKVIESMKAFTEIYVMTGGGPGNSTNILSMFVVKQITDFSNYGYGSAASILLLVLGVIAAVIFAQLNQVRSSGRQVKA